MKRKEETCRAGFAKLLGEGWPVPAAAARVGVTERTGYRWRREIAAERTARGEREAAGVREATRQEALRGLVRRVTGYMTEERKSTYELDEAGGQRIKGEVVTRKEVPPDLAAIVFVLTNTDPAHWQAKPLRSRAADPAPGTKTEDGGRGGDAGESLDLARLSDAALRELVALLEKPAEEGESGARREGFAGADE